MKATKRVDELSGMVNAKVLSQLKQLALATILAPLCSSAKYFLFNVKQASRSLRTAHN